MVAVLGVLSGVVVVAMSATTERAEESACAADERALVTALEAFAVTSGAYGDEDALVAAGHLASTSSSHDVVLSGDSYSVVATGDCVTGGAEEVAIGDEVAAIESTTTTLAPTTTTTAAPTASASISTILSVSKVNLSTNKWKATSTVRVNDELGGAVSGAVVVMNVQRQSLAGKWSSLPDVSGTTDGAGVLVVSSANVNKYPVPKIRFRVASVTAQGLVWQQDSAWSVVSKP